MAIVTATDNAAFDNLSASSGSITSRSSTAVTLAFSPVGSKLSYGLKLFGSFDAQGNPVAIEGGVYSQPDGSVVDLAITSNIPGLGVELGANPVRVDRLLDKLMQDDDVFSLGNQADAVNAGAGNDIVLTGGGADRVLGGPGNDAINGGAGVDLSIYSGPRSNYQIQSTSVGLKVIDNVGTDGTDTLSAIERLQFSDVRVAVDLDGSAGIVAKLLGAVFGAKAVGNRVYVGIGLSLLDQGMSTLDLAALAVSVTGNSAPADVVRLLWTNVIGSPPTAQDAAPFIDMLNHGTTVGELAWLAADTSFNQLNIDLVGLAKTGLEYLPGG